MDTVTIAAATYPYGLIKELACIHARRLARHNYEDARGAAILEMVSGLSKKKYDPSRCLRKYLSQIAYRAVFNYLKVKARPLDALDEDSRQASSNVEDDYVVHSNRLKLRELLHECIDNPIESSAFIDVVLDGKPPSEVAKFASLTTKQLSNRIQYLKMKLRRSEHFLSVAQNLRKM